MLQALFLNLYINCFVSSLHYFYGKNTVVTLILLVRNQSLEKLVSLNWDLGLFFTGTQAHDYKAIVLVFYCFYDKLLQT